MGVRRKTEGVSNEGENGDGRRRERNDRPRSREIFLPPLRSTPPTLIPSADTREGKEGRDAVGGEAREFAQGRGRRAKDRDGWMD